MVVLYMEHVTTIVLCKVLELMHFISRFQFTQMILTQSDNFQKRHRHLTFQVSEYDFKALTGADGY